MRRLQSLPESQRAAIVMRELEGLSHEEIADALGLSGGARPAGDLPGAARRCATALGMLLPLPLLKAMLAGAAGARRSKPPPGRPASAAPPVRAWP